MSLSSQTAHDRFKQGRKALFLVFLMLAMPLASFVPGASASHITQYAVQRDPSDIAVGDLNCDGSNDIVSASAMGHFITTLYNDGSGGFADRQDVFISNNNSQRAGFVDTANGVDVEVADINGDGINDIVYYQENIRFSSETFVRPGNLTILFGDCNAAVNTWSETAITISNPYHISMEVGDINDDGDDDIVLVTIDASFSNQYIQVFRGPDPSLVTNQQVLIVPLTSGQYTNVHLGHWGESVQGAGIGAPIGDCEDLDLWILRTPPYNAGVGFSVGHYDNITVLEYDCVQDQFPNPMTPTAQGIHQFKMDAEHNRPMEGMDISDTDGDGEVDMIAVVDGLTGNISYASKSGSQWDTQNYVTLGDYKGASITIEDVNRDGEVDFFVPTELTLTRVQDSSAQNQTFLLLDNLREINTVEIILADSNGPGYLSSLSFDVGRRPTMAVPGQLQGGDDSAFEIIIGQRDYGYRFANNAMWLDTLGRAGAGDFLSVLTLDNEDMGITQLTIEPASYNPSTGESQIGEGTRFVNVTVKNTGLNPLSGSINVDLEVKEVLGGSDTIVYSNNFDGIEDDTNCPACSFSKVSYTGMYGPGASSWHEESNASVDANGTSTDDPWEADYNPTTYMWAGLDYQGLDNQSGYFNNMDEALILENVDLTGADAAYLDISLMCSAAFFELYLAEPYTVRERWMYEDSCGIEVWSEGSGWESVFFSGGWDNERLYRILFGGVDPEYNEYDFNNYYQTLTGWNDYVEDGGESEDPNERESIDLTPYAGQVVDIRFRFRSGLLGTVGPEGSSYDTEWDGFAFDNITIRKRDVTFGTEEVVSDTLTFSNFAAGSSEEVSLEAFFRDNTTYLIKTELTSPSGFQNSDSTNDEIKFQTTVNNLFDPGLAEEPWTNLENGVRYASGTRDVEVRATNWGNTLTDFSLKAEIYNAEPDLVGIEDFSGVDPIWTDDGNGNGSRIDDSSGSNDMLPQNVGVFKNFAYWLGDPDAGYGDGWNETVTLDPIPIAASGTDFTYLTFDYYAEGDFLQDSQGNILAVRDAANLELTWTKDGELYQGDAYGSWTDLNENGIQNTNPEDPNFHRCEDFDLNGYDEVEYFGDHSDNINSVVWFDSESIMKSITLDLTHIVILNKTSSDSTEWRDECTSLAGSELSLTWRFQSNEDGINGNAGLAGFAVDNIRVEQFTFEFDANYTEEVTGLDASESSTITFTDHDFESGIYRIDAMTLMDTTDPTKAWYEASETNLANNISSVIFSIASAEITLMQPDVMECVTDITYECVYPIDDQAMHSFSVPLLNGVIDGDYTLTMSIQDLTTNQQVFEQTADNGPFALEPHQRDWANWSQPFNSWADGHTYNISFYADVTKEDNTVEPSGNVRFFIITFYDRIDVAILSNPTDQNRLQMVKSDLQSMDMSYTQMRLDNWDDYATPSWLEHYDKVLLPWQTDYNVYYGEYYDKLASTRSSDGLSVAETLEQFMVQGGTTQIHLGPYRDAYQPTNLPFGMDIAMRNQVNFTEDNRILSDEITIVDQFHPLLENVDSSAFSAINGGTHVALAGLDTAQVQLTQVPQVCGGRISDPTGTFHTLIRDNTYESQSLLSICNRGAGGMIVTTIDVENPSVTQAYGGEQIPILSNLLDYKLTPYPVEFGIAGEGYDLTVNGQSPSIDSITGAYSTMYIKSNSELSFDYVTNIPGILADWTLSSGNNDSVTGWDGAIIDSGEISHTQQSAPEIPTLGSFCVANTSSDTGCRIGAEWMLTLYLHDEEGHTRITYIRLVTDDTLADEFRPLASASILSNSAITDFIALDGTKTVAGKDWPIYRVRLTETGDISLSFTAENSTDPDAPEGESGIELFEWKVFFDYPWDSQSPTLEGHEFQVPASATDEWTYTFRNLTSNPEGTLENEIRVELIVYDKAGKQSEKHRMYFIVVGEDFGDEPPLVQFTAPRPTDSQREDLVVLTGNLISGAENGDVKIEVALDSSVLDYSSSQKITQRTIGKFNQSDMLSDGDSFTLTLDISDIYQVETGIAQTLFIRITEGDGSRYVISETIDISLVPRGGETGGGGTSGGGLSTTILAGVGGALLLVLVVVVTLVARGRSRAPIEKDTVEQFGGVETMDPVEAYVQQMVASGYDEQQARTYAEQYYASYYEQQRQGGS
tara:strand:+ start:5607 stop:12044 length:6438 start_codon:yes stop_codon:yes gene_type:complete